MYSLFTSLLTRVSTNVLSLVVMLVLCLVSIRPSFAAITFQDDDFHDIESEALLIDSDGTGIVNTAIQFGNDSTAVQNGVIYWNITNDEFQLSNGAGAAERSNLSFEIETVSVLPGGISGLGGGGEGRLVILNAQDTTAPGCTISPYCGVGTYIWNGSTWISLTGVTSSNFNKVVTVGSSGADYTSISAAASYLQTLSGGIILLSAETHVVTTPVNLTNVVIIGKDASRSTVQISGSGQLDTFDTTFEFLTLDVNSITDNMALDVQTGATSLIFSFVDIDVLDAGDSLIDSNAGVSPTVTMKFIKSNMAGGSGVVLKTIASSNLDALSSIFVDSRSSDNPLQISDWSLTLAGGGSVNTSGIIISVPAQSIFVSPQMNLQGAIDSLESVGNGGLIALLPGTHSITSTLTIEDDNIQIKGYGDSSIISASSISGGSTVAAIQIGAADGTAPVNGVVLSNFKLEVTGSGGTDIHGIRAAGGQDIRVDNVTVQKISGASGTGASARIGIQLIDGVSVELVRPVISDSRVFGNGGSNYFTDGIHVTSDPSISGVFGHNQGVINALLEGNNVDYVAETSYVFVGVENSSLFNNRATQIGAAGGGAYGIFMGNMSNVNMNANVFSTSLSTSAIAIGVESFNVGSLKQTVDSIFNANIIDGFNGSGVGFATGFQIGNASNTGVHRNSFQNNTIAGAVPATTVAVDVRGNADDNAFSFNNISGGTNPWDTGINLQSSSIDMSLIIDNRFDNVSTSISDGGTNTVMAVDHHRASVDPTANEDAGDGYQIGSVWINTSSDKAYILMDSSLGAAVWDQINVGASSATLDDAYNNDTGERTVFVDAGDVSWDITAANQFIVDLKGTGDFLIQDNGITFATFTDSGDLALDNNLTVGASVETISNVSFSLNGDDMFVADSLGVEGAIYSDDTETKYLWLALDGAVSSSASRGNKIGGLVPVRRLDPTGNSTMRWTFPVPDDWVSGTDIFVRVYWSPANSNTGNVQWDVYTASVPDGDTLTGSDFTNATPTEAAGGTTNMIQSEVFTISSAVIAADEVVFFTLNRDGAAGTDTFTGNVDVHELRIEYTGKKIL